MKRPTSITYKILCLFIITASFSCNIEQKEDKPTTPTVVEAPENIISIEEASALYDNYTKFRADIIKTYEQKERAPEKEFQVGRFVDFDYQTIKNYIAYVDQEASKAGVKKVTKLRLYFAYYPEEENFPDGKKIIHPRQNSIFMVPTLDKNGIDYSFYIGEDGKPKLIIDLKTNEKSHASIIPSFTLNSNLLNGGTSLALNRGNGGPPPKTDF